MYVPNCWYWIMESERCESMQLVCSDVPNRYNSKHVSVCGKLSSKAHFMCSLFDFKGIGFKR